MTSGESPGIPQLPASNMQSKQSSRLRTFKERHEQVFTCVRGDIPYELKAKYKTVLPLRENKDDKNDFSIHHKSVKTYFCPKHLPPISKSYTDVLFSSKPQTVIKIC